MLASVVGHGVNIESKEASKGQRLHSVYIVRDEFEFSAIFVQRSKVSAIDIENLFLKLDFDLERWRSHDTWNPDMIGSLVHHAKRGLLRTALLEQGYNLHDIAVADTHCSGVSERADMRVVRIVAQNERNHFQNAVVEHQCNEFARLAQEDWIRRFLLVVQDFLAYVTARNYVDFVFASVVG